MQSQVDGKEGNIRTDEFVVLGTLQVSKEHLCAAIELGRKMPGVKEFLKGRVPNSKRAHVRLAEFDWENLKATVTFCLCQCKAFKEDKFRPELKCPEPSPFKIAFEAIYPNFSAEEYI